MPQIIEFEGQRIEFPDDATDAEIAQILGGSEAAAPRIALGDARKPTDAGRALTLGTQDVGRGLANIPGALVDLPNAAINVALTGADKASQFLGGPEIPYRQPVDMARKIQEGSGSVADAFGMDRIPWEDRTASERAAGNIAEFGTEAIVGGGALAASAARRFATEAPKLMPRLGDVFLRPYAKTPGRTLTGDVGAGAGAGIGLTAAQENFPDNPVAALFAMLAGGAGGATATQVARAPKAATAGARSLFPDPNIHLEEGTLLPTSRRTAEHTARMLQGEATDLPSARQRLDETMSAARTNDEPMPTTGLASGDIGLTALEKGHRLKMSPKFEAADQRLRDAAQNRITGLLDETADQGAATKFAQERPGEIAAVRDAEALPLLRQAEASGATVNAQPVADAIDAKLTGAKRPPVRAALTEARKLLHKTGTEELDTSVSGLYETRKAIGDIIEGRGENATGRFAKKELIEVRAALDEALTEASPEFGEYLKKFREGSEPLDLYKESATVAKLLDDDPRNVAKRIFGGNEYGTERKLDEINTVLGSDAEAKRGWRAAVSEVLADKVTTTNTALTGGSAEGPLSVAALQKVFKRHENALAKTFSPEDMQALRRAHKMLEPLGNLRRQATTGSQTVENQNLSNIVQGTVLAYTGSAIQTGMIMARLKFLTRAIPGIKDATLEAKMEKLLQRAWFDPDIAKYLLNKDTKPLPGPLWNKTLNRAIAVEEFVQEDEE